MKKFDKEYYSKLIEGVTGFLDLSWYRTRHFPKVVGSKERYKNISDELGIPLCLIPLLETREMGPYVGKFSRYLGNGQRLDKKTTIVPKGRGPFFGPDAWEQGVRDALSSYTFPKKWSLEYLLYFCEKYNGFGYYYRKKPSAYLWSKTKPYHYKTGLFVKDGVYDPSKQDGNIGIYAAYTVLKELDSDFSLEASIKEPVKEEGQKSNFIDFLVELIKEFLSFLTKKQKEEPKAEDDPKEEASIKGFLEEHPEVDPRGIRRALDFFKDPRVSNKENFVFVDFDQSSRSKRLYIIGSTLKVWGRYKVAHGKKSDPNHDGLADTYSNISGSNKSSLGAMVTGSHYGKINGGYSKFNVATKLHGLEKGLNDNVEKRAIVFHSSKYVKEATSSISGRSLGCFAVDEKVALEIQKTLKRGTLLYAWDSDFL